MHQCTLQIYVWYGAGIVNGAGFGCAPVEAQQFWDEHSCSCAAKKGLCSGVACKLPTNVCPCPPPSPSPCAAYANGTAEPEDPRTFLPKAKHPWSQIPTRVEINGKPCLGCLSQLTPRTLRLQGDLLRASGTSSVAVHIYFGVLNGSTERSGGLAAALCLSVSLSLRLSVSPSLRLSVSLSQSAVQGYCKRRRRCHDQLGNEAGGPISRIDGRRASRVHAIRCRPGMSQ